MYTENMYLVLWAIIITWWALISVVIYKKSSEENRTINVVVGWWGVGALIAFLAFATNPFRYDGTATSREAVNFSVPSSAAREVPERIFVEPQLTDERRREAHEALREAARAREFFEFGEVLGHEDNSEIADEVEKTEAENKGE